MIGGWQNNRPMGSHADYRFVENIFEELDCPGEWYLDSRDGWLYLMPLEGVDLNASVVEALDFLCPTGRDARPRRRDSVRHRGV